MVVMSKKRRKTILAAFVITLVALGGVAFAASRFDTIRDSLTGNFAPTQQVKSTDALTAPQTITRGETTVTLQRADASGSQTALEFVIEDASFPNSVEGMQHIWYDGPLIPGDGLHLDGFAGGGIAPNVSSRREAGRIHLALELPPPAGFEKPVTVTFDSLTVRVDDPAQERSELRDLGGPWRFRINLQAPESLQGERAFTTDKQESSGPVTVRLKGEIRLSATETLIPFVVEVPPGAQTVDIMGASKIHADGQVLKGSPSSGGIGTQHGEDVSGVFSFPALPPTATRFTFETGPLLTTRERPAEVILDVAQLQDGSQTVTVAGHSLHFELAPATEGPGFEITYEPVNLQSVPFMLRGPGEPLEITDNLGQAYTEVGGTVDHDPENNYALKSHTIRVGEPLSEEAEQLTIYSPTTAEFTSPVRFEIDVGGG